MRLQPANSDLYYRLGICHSGGCRDNSLTNPTVAIEYLRNALSLTAPSDDSLLCASILDTLGNTYVTARRMPRKARLLAAIDCHGAAASLYQSRAQLEDWAREEYNLGNIWCEMPEDDYPDKWQQAIRHYEQALKVRTRERNPRCHAATLQNLGTAYRRLPDGNPVVNIMKAARCYRRALEIYDRKSSPEQYAALRNNLGNAYLSLAMVGGRNRQRCARHALEHLNRSLDVRTRAEFPVDYAVTQYNRGQAFLLLADGDPEACFLQATACFQEAHDCFLLGGHAKSARTARQQVQRVRLMAARQP